eukprot:jgi/Botrbrau1/12757/Bobra.67_1s0116.1
MIRRLPIPLFLVTIGSFVNQITSSNNIEIQPTLDSPFGSLLDLATYAGFLEAQVYPASTEDVFPTRPFLRMSLSNKYYRARKCRRVDVAICLRRGNSSNGLPEGVQGIWWQQGISYPEEIVTTSGTWDPVQRLLRVVNHNPGQWGYYDTSSIWKGSYFTFSGAAHLNFFVTMESVLNIYMNEDLTFGQAVPAFTVAGISMQVPIMVMDWSLALEPDGSWLRKSKSLGFDIPSADYTLRQVVDGEGRKGPYFDDMVRARDGRPFIYVEQIFP